MDVPFLQKMMALQGPAGFVAVS